MPGAGASYNVGKAFYFVNVHGLARSAGRLITTEKPITIEHHCWKRDRGFCLVQQIDSFNAETSLDAWDVAIERFLYTTVRKKTVFRRPVA